MEYLSLQSQLVQKPTKEIKKIMLKNSKTKNIQAENSLRIGKNDSLAVFSAEIFLAGWSFVLNRCFDSMEISWEWSESNLPGILDRYTFIFVPVRRELQRSVILYVYGGISCLVQTRQNTHTCHNLSQNIADFHFHHLPLFSGQMSLIATATMADSFAGYDFELPTFEHFSFMFRFDMQGDCTYAALRDPIFRIITKNSIDEIMINGSMNSFYLSVIADFSCHAIPDLNPT